jgi:hypothetical protein
VIVHAGADPGPPPNIESTFRVMGALQAGGIAAGSRRTLQLNPRAVINGLKRYYGDGKRGGEALQRSHFADEKLSRLAIGSVRDSILRAAATAPR